MKFPPVGAELFHADEQTDMFSYLYETAENLLRNDKEGC